MTKQLGIAKVSARPITRPITRAITRASTSIVLLSSAFAAYAEPLRCAEGTVLKEKSVPNMGVRSEWCEDSNGIKDGMQRYVRESVTL